LYFFSIELNASLLCTDWKWHNHSQNWQITTHCWNFRSRYFYFTQYKCL